MPELDRLIGKLMELKPDLSREAVLEQIRLKKEKIGSGYLTDQGALMLVATENGVNLAESLKTDLTLKDIYSGAKEVSLETRVLSLSPAKQFSRKDGTPFYLRTMTVYDSESTASVKLWDEKANLPQIEDLKPGDLIKIIKAYVKADRDGQPTINIGSGSTIEAADSQSSIPSIDMITKDISELQAEQKNIAISGMIDGMTSTLEYTSKSGEPKKALRMRLKGRDHSAMRVVIWGQDESVIPKIISQDAQVKLLGVNIRQGNQGLEIHGNDATIINIQGQKETDPVIARVITINPADGGKNMILVTDSSKNLSSIVDTAGLTVNCAEGDVIECMPSRMHGNSITLDENSFVRKLDDDQGIPTLPQVRAKLSDIKADQRYCIEAIVLNVSGRREIQTKTGEQISLSEILVEDDTAQIWIKGWRNQSGLLEKWEPGEILSITGVTAKTGLEGRTELVLTAFSKVTKKS